MALDPVKNFAKVTVSLGYDNDDVTIVLSAGDGAKLPAPSVDGAFNLVWWNSTDYPNPSDDPYKEIVRCTTRSIDTLTITRAQESTLATNKNIVGKTYIMILAYTKKMQDDIVALLHTQGTDQKLDEGGANEVAVADVKDAVDKKHAQHSDDQDASEVPTDDSGVSVQDKLDELEALAHAQHSDDQNASEVATTESGVSVQDKLDELESDKADKHISISEQTNNYVLVLSDDNKLIDMNKATVVTLTIPKNSVVAFLIGATIAIRQKGAGKVTIAPIDGDVIINNPDGLKINKQYAMASLVKIAINTWAIAGSLEA